MPIIIKDLTFIYNPKSPFETKALDKVNLTIEDGDFMCVIGHTGSGKSTLIQHLNGLIRVQTGSIIIDDINLTEKKVDLKRLRSTVGMVFQYPEYQLFADTVYNDVAFGPKNLKLSAEDVNERVTEAIQLVGLDFEYIKDKSPFELSGGEKRRVAIAGVIAMRPKILVLDEPTAGLDPKGKKEILDLILKLKQTTSHTIVMVNHDMDEVASYATKIAVFNEAKIAYVLSPIELFKKTDELKSLSLDIPQMAKLRDILIAKNIVLDDDCLTVDKMFNEILKKAGKKNV